MPNQEQSSLSINILKYAKPCVSWGAIADLQKLDSDFFHRDSLIMAKCFIFFCIFGDLDRDETGDRRRE